MAGLEKDTPIPTGLVLHTASGVLEVQYPDARYRLPFEFLRVYSPSAEVRGHGMGQEILQTGKRDVRVTRIDGVGHYAIRLGLSDGHDTGIYSWDYLYTLATRQDALWQDYLTRLEAAGASRDGAVPGQPVEA
ncbi:gamma-butyrobetaine hydroxylase-like domain-containing protein [Robbsia andropogonis]|uniref:gamma-butyrobetaine hydroxylase-like domain-containing protein n=1 Tax=Robbsia andropogonis TaxID=28092 RepID=UPI003D219AAA